MFIIAVVLVIMFIEAVNKNHATVVTNRMMPQVKLESARREYEKSAEWRKKQRDLYIWFAENERKRYPEGSTAGRLAYEAKLKEGMAYCDEKDRKEWERCKHFCGVE